MAHTEQSDGCGGAAIAWHMHVHCGGPGPDGAGGAGGAEAAGAGPCGQLEEKFQTAD